MTQSVKGTNRTPCGNSPVLLGLGSNQGDRAANLQRALEMLAARGVELIQVSRVYETLPWGLEDQPDFYNSVARVTYSGSARDLLALVLQIEKEMGRFRTQKWGPRLIDIDILEFKGEVHEESNLSIPHPWYTRRPFVLVPLAEICPDFVPIGQEHSVTEILAEMGEEARQIKAIDL